MRGDSYMPDLLRETGWCEAIAWLSRCWRANLGFWILRWRVVHRKLLPRTTSLFHCFLRALSKAGLRRRGPSLRQE